MSTQSDYLLQKNPERARLYGEQGGIRWSTELKRWLISDPTLLREVMTNPNFVVHGYDVTPIMERLNIDLRHMSALRQHLPLAFEGEKHAALRRRMATEIAANTASALDVFDRKFAERLESLSTQAPGTRFCLVRDLFQPTLKWANLRLAGLEDDIDAEIEAVPQLFDDTISLKMRMKINAIIGQIFERLPGDMDDDARYLRTAILALNANTLLGSMTRSFATTIAAHAQTPLSRMPWPTEMPVTGLPLIEKKALNDAMLGGQAIKAGDRLRLFIEAAGYRNGGGPSYSELYFAVGPHQCPGKSFSRQIWKLTVKHVARIDRRLTLIDAAYRGRDHVFNLYERLEAAFDV